MRSLLRLLLYVVVVWAFLSYCSCAGMQHVNTLPGAGSANIPDDHNKHILNAANFLALAIKHARDLGGNTRPPTVCYPQDAATPSVFGAYVGKAVHLPRDYL
jgi:hypothetical protein